MMMTKDAALADVGDQSTDYKTALAHAKEERKKFVKKIRTASEAKATQLEIAEATGYSRQRIAQFLKEKDDDGDEG